MRIFIGTARSVSDWSHVGRKVRRRCDKMIPMDVIAWADNWGSAVSKSLRDFSLTADDVALEEGYEAALSLVAAYESLKARQQP